MPSFLFQVKDLSNKMTSIQTDKDDIYSEEGVMLRSIHSMVTTCPKLLSLTNLKFTQDHIMYTEAFLGRKHFNVPYKNMTCDAVDRYSFVTHCIHIILVTSFLLLHTDLFSLFGCNLTYLWK